MLLWQTIVLGIHVLGACIWVGGTFALGVVVAALSRGTPPGDPTASERTATVARALGWVMWPALAVTIVTGGINLSWWLPPGNWTATIQGQWLVAKIVVIGILLLSAGGHSFLLGPRIRRLRREGVAENRLGTLRRINAAFGVISATASVLVIFFAVMLASF
jgi:uncharacterized membrane protein